MKINSVCFGYSTNKLDETKSYYEKYLDAQVGFETEGYVVLLIGDPPLVLEFSSSEVTSNEYSDYTGVGFNIEVNSVNEVYEEMILKEVKIAVALEEHPWGERGFCIKDPNGVMIYIFMRIESQSKIP